MIDSDVQIKRLNCVVYKSINKGLCGIIILNSRMKLVLKLTTFFSKAEDVLMTKLLVKVPKEVEIDVSPGFLSLFFDRTKKSASYLLQKELFAYLQDSPVLAKQFPFLKSDERFEQNWMTLHLHMLKNRFLTEKKTSDAVNQLELETFDYNAQAYFFPDYAKYLHPHTPTLNFAPHFSQAYLKRFHVFEEYFNGSYEPRPNQETLTMLLRKLVYENRVSTQDAQLMKLSRYYLAHRRYLGLMNWRDLLTSKIKWGFEEERRLLQPLGSSQL